MHRWWSALLLAGAGATSNAQQPSPTVQQAIADIGLAIASERCGAHARTATIKVPNRFDEQIIDERTTVRCRNTRLVIYRSFAHKPPQEVIESLTVTGQHPKLPAALSPGSTRREALAFAGRPMWEDKDFVVYLLNSEGPDQETSTLRFVHDRLSSITWVWVNQ